MRQRRGQPGRSAITPSSGGGAEPLAPRAGSERALDRPDPAVRVLCVDDHELLVDGLAARFGIDGVIGIVGWLPNAERLLDEVARLRPHVVLLDVEMPGPDAFEIADRLRHMFPHVRVVFLSAHVRDAYLAAAFNAGASGYFSKCDDLKVIAAAIRQIAGDGSSAPAAREFLMGPKVRARCIAAQPASTSRRPKAPRSADGQPKTRLATLSPREAEVLRLIGKGLSRTQIAAELSRSAKTVDGHQDRILRKLGIHTRSDLIRWAIREGFAEA